MKMISKKLGSSEYTYLPEINPKWVRIQRIQASISGNNLSFRARNPIPNAFLSAKAQVKWVFRSRRQEAGVDADFVTFNQAAMSMKNYSILSNCSRQSSLSLNGYKFMNQDPRYFSQYLAKMFLTEEELGGYYSTSGGAFVRNDGALSTLFFNTSALGVNRTDPVLDENMDLAYLRWRTGRIPAVSATADWEFLDYVDVPPFNPLFDFKDKLYDCWYSKMSNLIPYVNDLELEYRLDKVMANTAIFPWSVRQNAGPGNIVELIDDGILSAELILTWVVSDTVSLPKEILLPAWSVDIRSFEINDGAAIQDIVLVGQQASFQSPEIPYFQTPNYLLIFAARDKDQPEYKCQALRDSDDTAGLQLRTDADVNSYDCNMRFRSLLVKTNLNTQVVDRGWSEMEIFAKTSSLCREMTHSFSAYTGGLLQYASQPCQSFALFKTDDLNLETPGTLTDFTLQIQADLLTATGYHVQGPTVGSYVYRFFVVSFYAEDFISMTDNGIVEKRVRSQFL